MMDELDKLIEQAVNYGRLAKIEEHNYDEIRNQLEKFNIKLKNILASRPTCGVEQRKFLDEIEREYKTDYFERGLYKPSKNGPWNTCFIFQDEAESDLQKVLNGE